MATWPPTLAQLKVDMKIADTRDDAAMALDLAAAISYVQRVLADRWNFDGTLPNLPAPVGDDLALGTLRLAARSVYRRRSPDGTVGASDIGAVRVPSTDADIERLLQTGRYAPMRFG